MSDEYPRLRDLSRQRMGLIWELAQTGAELTDEDARLAEILRQHSEYQDVWEDAGSLGAQEVLRDGVNPFVHIYIHTVVENQLAENDPPQTAETLEALLQAGTSRHDAIHAIGRAVSDEIFGILKEKRPFDEEAYLEALQDLVREAQRRGRRGSRGRRGRRGG